ncbi:MAG: hypothetical protein ABIR39_21830 [Nocardioides sp.]|uniref:hypothetical protein n=1 Tax=Nocardioides sp. TaxID=35761 RepID=UPI00326478CA
MNSKEQAAFDALTAELNEALMAWGEPAVADHPAFSVEPGWFPGSLHVHVVREGAAPFVFITEDDWVRVDVGVLPEVLGFPLFSRKRRWRRRLVTFAEALPRLLTSSVTVTRNGRRRLVSLTDESGEVWSRYTNFTRASGEGPADGTFQAVVTRPRRVEPNR